MRSFLRQLAEMPIILAIDPGHSCCVLEFHGSNCATAPHLTDQISMMLLVNKSVRLTQGCPVVSIMIRQVASGALQILLIVWRRVKRYTIILYS
jgi:hypothetical protein